MKLNLDPFCICFTSEIRSLCVLQSRHSVLSAETINTILSFRKQINLGKDSNLKQDMCHISKEINSETVKLD